MDLSNLVEKVDFISFENGNSRPQTRHGMMSQLCGEYSKGLYAGGGGLGPLLWRDLYIMVRYWRLERMEKAGLTKVW